MILDTNYRNFVGLRAFVRTSARLVHGSRIVHEEAGGFVLPEAHDFHELSEEHYFACRAGVVRGDEFASAVERATIACSFDFQATGPPLSMTERSSDERLKFVMRMNIINLVVLNLNLGSILYRCEPSFDSAEWCTATILGILRAACSAHRE